MKSIFDQIITRTIPADIIYEDDRCLAFRDIRPQAPVHLLVIPKLPIARLGAAGREHESLLGHLLLIAQQVARKEQIEATGYRIVINHGADGGETVPHLHLHVLGGRSLAWPPG